MSCNSRVFMKKEEMIRHFKWHKKRDESLTHGFLRCSPADNCLERFRNCPHHRKQTHYHCLKRGCDKASATLSPEMTYNWLAFFFANRCTSALQMCRCMPTTIEKTRPLSRKVFSVFAPRRTVYLRRAPFSARKQRTFTVAETTATTHSRTKPTWVSVTGQWPVSFSPSTWNPHGAEDCSEWSYSIKGNRVANQIKSAWQAFDWSKTIKMLSKLGAGHVGFAAKLKRKKWFNSNWSSRRGVWVAGLQIGSVYSIDSIHSRGSSRSGSLQFPFFSNNGITWMRSALLNWHIVVCNCRETQVVPHSGRAISSRWIQEVYETRNVHFRGLPLVTCLQSHSLHPTR